MVQTRVTSQNFVDWVKKILKSKVFHLNLIKWTKLHYNLEAIRIQQIEFMLENVEVTTTIN